MTNPTRLPQDAFGEQLSQTQAIQSQIAELELQLIELRNRRDERLANIWETTSMVNREMLHFVQHDIEPQRHGGLTADCSVRTFKLSNIQTCQLVTNRTAAPPV